LEWMRIWQQFTTLTITVSIRRCVPEKTQSH
jgi:hypothetical protein